MLLLFFLPPCMDSSYVYIYRVGTIQCQYVWWYVPLKVSTFEIYRRLWSHSQYATPVHTCCFVPAACLCVFCLLRAVTAYCGCFSSLFFSSCLSCLITCWFCLLCLLSCWFCLLPSAALLLLLVPAVLVAVASFLCCGSVLSFHKAQNGCPPVFRGSASRPHHCAFLPSSLGLQHSTCC